MSRQRRLIYTQLESRQITAFHIEFKKKTIMFFKYHCTKMIFKPFFRLHPQTNFDNLNLAELWSLSTLAGADVLLYVKL